MSRLFGTLCRTALLATLPACFYITDGESNRRDRQNDLDGDGFSATLVGGTDCDDVNPNVNPESSETCNGLDDNCDGVVDEGTMVVVYVDADGDGFGERGSEGFEACEGGEGHVRNALDCDDTNANVHPEASEQDATCDGIDNDCDGQIDPDQGIDWYPDTDGDGFGDGALVQRACEAPGTDWVGNSDDCDDTDDLVHPGVDEHCDDVDWNCDLDTIAGAVDPFTWYYDADGDGYGGPTLTEQACVAPAGFSEAMDDCDDFAANIHPGAEEVCNAIDDNCSGQVDDNTTIQPGIFLDADGDGYGVASSEIVACVGAAHNADDCDDFLATTHPGADELCNGVDDNCNVAIDDLPVDATAWYLDVDRDGFGDPGSAMFNCGAPIRGRTKIGDDCDDSHAGIHPDADERCDLVDRNCDGDALAGAVNPIAWHPDADGDGFGDADSNATVESCLDPTTSSLAYLRDNTDCHDDLADAFPYSSAIETPLDGIDQDCDGLDVCTDLNCDGIPDVAFSSTNFDQPTLGLITNNLLQSGLGTWALETTAFAQHGGSNIVVLDLNADGYQDIVTADYMGLPANAPSGLSAIHWGGPFGHSRSNRTDLPTDNGAWVCAGDFDGDGDQDLAFSASSSGVGTWQNAVQATQSKVFWNEGGHFSDAASSPVAAVESVFCLAEDFDADGADDLVLVSRADAQGNLQTDSTLYYGAVGDWRTNPDLFSTRVLLPTYRAAHALARDINQDGHTDILFTNGGNIGLTNPPNPDDDSYVYWGSPTGFSAQNRLDIPGELTSWSAVDDINNDGLLDIVLAGSRNPVDWSLGYASHTNVFLGTNQGWQRNNYIPLPSHGASKVVTGDLNSDGFPDIVVDGCDDDPATPTGGLVYFGTDTGISNPNSGMFLPSACGIRGLTLGDIDLDGHLDIVLPGNTNHQQNGTLAPTYIYWGGPDGPDPSRFSTYDNYRVGPTVIVGRN